MENASKALLIAGAIILSVLIISIGMYIVNKTNSITNLGEAELNISKIQAFNSKYETYEGIQHGKNVKKVLQYAIQDNNILLGDSQRAASTIDRCLNIRSNHPSILSAFSSNASMKSALTTRSYGVRYAENIEQISRVINPKGKYKLSFSYSTANGYIWEIHIDFPEE